MSKVEGTMLFHVELEIRASDMRSWSPYRIARFFDGLARAIAARCEPEEVALTPAKNSLPPNANSVMPCHEGETAHRGSQKTNV